MAKEQKQNEQDIKLQDVKDLQLELLLEKIKSLENNQKKPQTADEAFQARVQKYESSQAERDKLKQEIEKRKMELWSQNPRMRQDEVILIEAWERRAKSVESSNPDFAKRLRYEIRMKIKEVSEDSNR